jgi:HemY protein
MRSVIWLILLFVAAVVAASAFGQNDALVSLFYGHWRLDLSLNLFLLSCWAWSWCCSPHCRRPRRC